MSRKARKFKGFFRPKLGDLQKKKKKRSSPKFRVIFLTISQVRTFEGGSFRMGGGGYFPCFAENRPQKHKKHAILHTSQANGGARAPPPPPPPRPPPPGYATGHEYLFVKSFTCCSVQHFGHFSPALIPPAPVIPVTLSSSSTLIATALTLSFTLPATSSCSIG